MKEIHWQRMGERDAISWGMFIISVAGFGAAHFFTNYLRDPNLSSIWVAVWLVAQAGTLLVYLLLKELILDQLPAGAERPWVNLLIVAFLGALQELIATGAQMSWGLFRSEDVVFSMLASSSFALVLFGTGANFEQSLKLSRSTLASLLRTRDQLIGLRENSAVIVAEEEQKLIQQTQADLLPQLELIDASLESTGFARDQRAKLIQDIKHTIETQVRPLSDELKTVAHTRGLPLEPLHSHSRPLQWSWQLQVRDAFRSGEFFWTTLGIFVAICYSVLGPLWGFFGLLAALHYRVWLGIIHRLIPANLTLMLPAAVFVLSLLALLPMVPVAAALFAFVPNLGDAVLVTAAMAFTILSATVALALLHSVYQQLSAFEFELGKRIAELTRETSSFEQRLWSARRNWGYIIHGTVQSSLTAALMHLQQQEGTDEERIKVVRQDIRRAVQALRERPVARADFQLAMAELTETWAGVCDIDFHLSREAREALQVDADLCFCTKEILKEAVANAVRHGGASRMAVSLEIENGHTLLLEAVNNGRALAEVGAAGASGGAAARTGLGSQIVQDLTYFWSLKSDEESGQTTLIAKIALPGEAGGGGRA